jgi:hypothetical protein
MHGKWCRTINLVFRKSYRSLNKLISVGASTDNHGDGHLLGSDSLARSAPFGLLRKERRLEESSRKRHCF